MTEPDFLDIAVRAYTEPRGFEPPKTDERQLRRLLRHRRRDNRRPVLIFDTETRTDPSQRLMFGAYRFCRWAGDRLVCLLEGLMYADDLPEQDLRTIRDYWRRHKMQTGADQSMSDSAPTLYLISERQFVRLLYRACHEPGPRRAAALVGLNLNFDISRLAVDWGESRTNKYANGFTLKLREGYTNDDGELRDSPHHPRYGTKHLSSTKALKGFIAKFTGHIIDVRTLMFALTNRGYSLETGSKAFSVPYSKRKVEYGVVNPEAITYCREDVEATQRLYEQAMLEFDRHAIPLQASQAYSPASIGKAYLAGMGIRPRLELQPDFPREQLGIAMSAFYGGRTEAKMVRTPVPVVYCDLMSAYTTGNSLMDLWRLVIAEHVELVGATAEVRALVETIDLDACLNPETWKRFPALVQIKPSGEDVPPVRGRYQRTGLNIGSNYLDCDEPLWYALPDVIDSKLITGRAPEIIRALKLTASGEQGTLRPIKLRAEVKIDPRENFFRAVVERRHELEDKKGDLGQFLKTLANAASYGIYAEMIRTELPRNKTERVLVCDWTGEPYESDERNPERPGRYFFAPLAAIITAGTRLLLTITERLVTDAGGTWGMMDTDSIAVVSTEHGATIDYTDHTGTPRSIQALSWAQEGVPLTV